MKGKKERVNNRYTPEFKRKVVEEYLKTTASLHQLADKHDIYPQMIVRWKKLLLAEDKELQRLVKPMRMATKSSTAVPPQKGKKSAKSTKPPVSKKVVSKATGKGVSKATGKVVPGKLLRLKKLLP